MRICVVAPVVKHLFTVRVNQTLSELAAFNSKRIQFVNTRYLYAIDPPRREHTLRRIFRDHLWEHHSLIFGKVSGYFMKVRRLMIEIQLLFNCIPDLPLDVHQALARKNETHLLQH